MARMHSRKKGKAGSKKPMISAQWVSYDPKEVERLIVKLRKEGMTSAKSGMVLRDQYGIPSVREVTKKTVKQILKENDVLPDLPEDLLNLLRKSVNLKNHMEKNKKDYGSKHGLELLQSKIRRLGKYYIKRKELPEDWKYNAERAKLIVQTTK
jgi:small subunit ribosomal protein S15